MTISKWSHEKKRIYSAIERSGGRSDSLEFLNIMRRRLKAIKSPEKAHNFGLALEDENLHGLAGDAFLRERELRMESRVAIPESILAVDQESPLGPYCEKCWLRYAEVLVPADRRCKYCGGRIIN